ncbi:DUF4179 domain-containing protein [Psychrobacillus sp. INOP01]|uniref:DUF4179 domain-containing protein n=1 Tax=Psychrobacillus sp. INOP01 TaxID=2829187 RepID=UPI001BA6E37F|nr:DUF4179 domain-containing protein [Psychrobacillus sp. INOP01]QUG40392.1 DUF4179 domain-containing protein [Psychrobacillus sp. INOP01]
MYEKEEEMLDKTKKRLEQVVVPEQLVNDAIQQGVLQAKAKKRNRKKTLWAFSVAAILILTFITSIRVSPTFASAISTIPGMERFVHLIQFDKGIKAIVENDYYEPIGKSQVNNNITFTVDGIIIDETGAEIFYTLEAPYSLENIDYQEVKLLNDGQELIASIGYDLPDQETANRKVDKFSFVFVDTEQFTSNNFEVQFEVEQANKTTSFHVPFTIKNEMKSGKIYTLNETVEIDGQQIEVKEIKVYPLRVAVTLEFDEQNEMKILQFEDMRIEDENGEVWSSIQNGITGFGENQNKVNTYFLQSNYFKEPKELYLKFSKVQALPKEESYLLIDFAKKEILEQPSHRKVEVLNVGSNSIEVKYHPIRENHMYSLFSQGENAKGKVVDIPTQSNRGDEEEQFSEITLDAKDIINPVKIDFIAYPDYLGGSVSIQIK